MGKHLQSEKCLRSEVLSISLTGLVASLVSIVVTIETGASMFQLVGLAEVSLRETKVRVRSALAQVGMRLDGYNITVKVCPADLRNDGVFDLAIATAVILAFEKKTLPGTVVLGELSLSGVRPVRGVLPALRGAASKGIQHAIVPRANLGEAASVPDLDVRVAGKLDAVQDYLRGACELERASVPFRPKQPGALDLSDMRGMASTRRAIEIAAAGQHSILFIGPPGAGITMASRRIPTILPPMSVDEALEVTSIHSVAGLLNSEQGLATNRPFRAPHHTVTPAGLVGGGEPVRPGEVSLAHGGVLFLDELPEFRRSSLALLETTLAQGEAVIIRGQIRTVFPARPFLVLATHACPCGFYRDAKRRCTCSVEQIRRHRERVHGPLFERVDMQIVVPPVDVAQLGGKAKGENSETVRNRVVAARTIQHARAARQKVASSLNTALNDRELERIAAPDAQGKRALEQSIERLGLSASLRAKVLRVARTIADLDRSEVIRAPHVAEAVLLAPVFGRG
ncbi:YifB family Mg chelatase-like AAA ATPase [Polyangium sorediatum]|uniref:YifB family Mg chelatase-like AAA ATPase n=1 Tax=Polyangium sorediatum TaxID=889274 RepID=A0ABT6P940_9BACT|nr:YifB family Mg chelatase-like AAA ATPase [Polyangium sorediatum]MDI1437126.1 YifB family Mg chelatase-like AAA ATPase [Polyangium sorediatum]